MKQVFEIETEPSNMLTENDIETDIGFFSQENKIKKISVRDITPHWTKELPREEKPYWVRGSNIKPKIVDIHSNHNGLLGADIFPRDWVPLSQLLDCEWSDRPVLTPEDKP